MPVVHDSLQHRRNRFALGFYCAPLFFTLWAVIGHAFSDPLYSMVTRESADGMFIVLVGIAFFLPLVIATLLRRGHALEHFPIYGAVLILASIGVLFAFLLSGLVSMSTHTFTELFLSGMILLGYSIALLLMRRARVVRHFAPDTQPLRSLPLFKN